MSYIEEIPARFQLNLEKAISENWQKGLDNINIEYSDLQVFYPNRLALHCLLPTHTKSHTIEQRGPREGAKEQAIQGFIKGLGCQMDDLVLRENPQG